MGKKRTTARRAAAVASTATTAPPPSVSVAPEDDAVACDRLELHTAPAQQQHDAHAANTWPEPRVSSLAPSTSSLVPHTTTETAQGVSVAQDAVTCPHTVANGPKRRPPITIANPHDPRSPNAYHARRTASPTSHTHTASPNDAPTPSRRTARIPAADNEPNELFAACPADSPDEMDANTPHTPTTARLVQQAPSAASNDVPVPACNAARPPTPGFEPGEPRLAATYESQESELDFVDRVHHDEIVAIAIQKGFDAGLKTGRNEGFREGLDAGTKAGRHQRREEGSNEGTERDCLEVSVPACTVDVLADTSLPRNVPTATPHPVPSAAPSTSHSTATPAHLATSIEEIDPGLLAHIRKTAEDEGWEEGCDAGTLLGRGRGYQEGYDAAKCEVSTTRSVPNGVDMSPNPTSSSTSRTDPALHIRHPAPLERLPAPGFEPRQPLAAPADEPREACGASLNTTPAPSRAPPFVAMSLFEIHPDLLQEIAVQNERRGLKQGKKEGRAEGYNEGLEAGRKEGRDERYQEGLEVGRKAGTLDGRERGFMEGKSAGVQVGRALERADVRRIARTSVSIQTDIVAACAHILVDTAIQTEVVPSPRTVSLASQTDTDNGRDHTAVTPPRPAPVLQSLTPGFEPGGRYAGAMPFIDEPDPTLLDPIHLKEIVVMALHDGHAAGLEEGRHVGLHEGVKVGHEQARAEACRIMRTSCQVQTDDPPVPVHVHTAVTPAPFSWADDADSLPIRTPPPLCSAPLRDYSILRSNSVTQPFGSIQRRVQRSHRHSTHAPQFRRYRSPPSASLSWRSSIRPAHPVHSMQQHTSSLDWATDPRLSELARVLRGLGWVQPLVSSGQGAEATRTLPCWRGAHGVGRQGLPPSRGWVSSGV